MKIYKNYRLEALENFHELGQTLIDEKNAFSEEMFLKSVAKII